MRAPNSPGWIATSAARCGGANSRSGNSMRRGRRGSWSRRSVDIRATPRRPHLTLDLSEFEFDPRYAAEYLQRHLKPGTDLIDLLHDANEGRERTCHHTDQVILLEHPEIGHGHLHHQYIVPRHCPPTGHQLDSEYSTAQ